MIKKYCDKCQEEIIDQDFRCEIILIQVEPSFLNPVKTNQPQLVKKELQMCKKCYKDNINL